MLEDLDLHSIADEQARELVRQLLNLLEDVRADLRAAQAENQRLRDEARRNLEHIGGLETSNRKLLDSLAENAVPEREDGEGAQAGAATRAAPRLVVPETKSGRGEAESA